MRLPVEAVGCVSSGSSLLTRMLQACPHVGAAHHWNPDWPLPPVDRAPVLAPLVVVIERERHAAARSMMARRHVATLDEGHRRWGATRMWLRAAYRDATFVDFTRLQRYGVHYLAAELGMAVWDYGEPIFDADQWWRDHPEPPDGPPPRPVSNHRHAALPIALKPAAVRARTRIH